MIELQPNTTYNDTLFNLLDIPALSISSSEFFECDFRRCSFVEANLLNCRFVNCRFQHCDLSLIKIEGSDFSGTKFEYSKLIGIDWTRGVWPEVQIRSPNVFSNCVINHSTFIGLDLTGIRFIACAAMDVDFREANLSLAEFSDTDLTNSLFVSTQLSKADFRSARNYQINPGQNNIEKAKFSLPEAMSLLYNLDIDLSDNNLPDLQEG